MTDAATFPAPLEGRGATASAPRLRVGAAWIVAIATELVILAGILSGTVPLAVGLAIHGALCVGLLVLARQQHGSVDPGLALLAVWTLLTGPFGPLIAAIGSLARRASSSGLDARFDDLLAGDPEDPATLRVSDLCDALADGRINTSPPRGIKPLLQTLESGNQAEALAALRAASTDFGPDLAPVIRRATVSDDAAVRVLAATVLANLKKDFSDRVSAARLTVEQAPDDSAARHALFDACMAYANSGLLSDDLASEMRRTAFSYGEVPSHAGPAVEEAG